MKKWILTLAIAACSINALAYYNPEQGRWLNRDPIEENGGLNLYAMLNNDAINNVDFHGLKRYRLKYDLAPSASFWTGAKSVESFSEIREDVVEKLITAIHQQEKEIATASKASKSGDTGGLDYCTQIERK